jgi:hypothetical protein
MSLRRTPMSLSSRSLSWLSSRTVTRYRRRAASFSAIVFRSRHFSLPLADVGCIRPLFVAYNFASDGRSSVGTTSPESARLAQLGPRPAMLDAICLGVMKGASFALTRLVASRCSDSTCAGNLSSFATRDRSDVYAEPSKACSSAQLTEAIMPASDARTSSLLRP